MTNQEILNKYGFSNIDAFTYIQVKPSVYLREMKVGFKKNGAIGYTSENISFFKSIHKKLVKQFNTEL